MLKQLYIKNFAIISELMIEWQSGMTVLTGETGAGKSIIIDAIGQLIGDRFMPHLIHDLANQAFVEGVIDLTSRDDLKQKLKENGFSLEDDMLVVSKEMNRDGKNIYRINYRQTTQSFVRDLMRFVDIHSQHDNQYLLNQKMHLPLLDQYVVSMEPGYLSEYLDAYSAYQEALKVLAQTKDKVVDASQLDFLLFQLNEIESLDLQVGELEQLETDYDRIKNLEKYQQVISMLLSLIDDEQGLSSMLYQAQHAVHIDDSILNRVQLLFEEAYYKVEESRDLLKQLSDDLMHDDFNIEAIQERYFAVNKLKRKYGQSYDAIMEAKETIQQQVEWIEDFEVKIEDAKKQVEKAQLFALEKAGLLTKLRKSHALALEKEIQSQLKSLSLDSVQFKIMFASQPLSKSGCDDVTFYLSLNAGQTPKPLHQVASGGELSRVMLGLKSIFAMLNHTGTIIFDEVDTGVSGKVASCIGQKMSAIAKDIQVLCITHLPQVAGYANQHLHVSKKMDLDQTIVEVNYLSKDGRVEALAKMLSGSKVNEQALENAKALINDGL